MTNWQSITFPTDMYDEQLEAAVEEFQQQIMDAHTRRELRYIINETDDPELAEAAFKVLEAYVVGPADPNLPGD